MRKTSSDIQYAEISPGICIAALIPVRKEAREQSEMISQLLFGEYYRILSTTVKWLKITTVFDDYTGWIDRKFYHGTGSAGMVDQLTSRQPVMCSKIAEIEFPDRSTQLIPAGSSLPQYDPNDSTIRIDQQKVKVRSVFAELLLPPTQQIIRTACQFLNTPYVWGGRSTFGFDCSGFVQTVYKIHGISLPRDTTQQVQIGKMADNLDETVAGDLAFFAGEGERINHVGMIMPEGEIIHCSGWVRIDRLDEKGIFNRESGVYTHRLKEVRRVIPRDQGRGTRD